MWRLQPSPPSLLYYLSSSHNLVVCVCVCVSFCVLTGLSHSYRFLTFFLLPTHFHMSFLRFFIFAGTHPRDSAKEKGKTQKKRQTRSCVELSVLKFRCTGFSTGYPGSWHPWQELAPCRSTNFWNCPGLWTGSVGKDKENSDRPDGSPGTRTVA